MTTPTQELREQIDLLPCPFCGSDDVAPDREAPGFDHGYAVCMDCYARAHPKTWNRRTPPLSPGAGVEWQPISALSEGPQYINVRSVTTYRWLPYKPEGARQMGRPGRWQRATGYGWESAKLPENGEWKPNLPLPSQAKDPTQ